jgi:dTDP-glucose 4,6-dehydratase
MAKIIYVDIDGTICTVTDGDYEASEPIRKTIEKINALYDEGNTIVYWTARGTTTGIDWRKTTERQLGEWNAKYHKLVFGKPYFDLYICDKSINVKDL